MCGGREGQMPNILTMIHTEKVAHSNNKKPNWTFTCLLENVTQNILLWCQSLVSKKSYSFGGKYSQTLYFLLR